MRPRSIRGRCSRPWALPATPPSVRRLPGTVVSVDPRRGRLGLADGSTVAGERVFLTLGAWAGAEGLLGPDRPRLPVRPVKGEVVRLRAVPGGDAV